ncbi:hypothetical protein [uncultured Flavobacterium sp.]|uniref:hypothetical protein n=1 Tax=uncultured Flavobacterium sp. TaxID=165435 RepID=UPI0025CC94BF|nr:hypothetical protein [uncultured Flavobacterium sp.]
MEKINWIQVISGFLVGLSGILIKQFLDNKKSRIQPIAKSIEVKSFYDSKNNDILNSKVTFTESGKEYKFSNLYTGTIKITNSGSADYKDFVFGITASENINFIHVKPNSNDRHHFVEISDLPSLENQINYFDVSLKPFNRKDTYTLDVLLTASEVVLSENDIKMSTSQPIKWTDLNSTTNKTVNEILNTIIKESIIIQIR